MSNQNSSNNDPLKSATGKNKTIWQALNEAEDEDILHFMEAVQAIGIYLDCKKEYDSYEYKRALQGWSDLNNAFTHESLERIRQYSNMIEGE